jgi:3-hydroxybutyryl-CoA dehydrogenase
VTDAIDRGAIVGVVGAGAMGAGIAQVAAIAGHPLVLHDTRSGAVDSARASIAKSLSRFVDKAKLDPDAAEAAAGRVVSGDLSAVAGAQLIVEAVVEDLAVKRSLMVQLESRCEPATILATNTSTISIDAIAEGLRRPERVCGMHFFNPAPLMRLVEVPNGARTSPEVAATVRATAEAWGKTAVVCASTPGFIVNRVARPFYGEAQRVLEEGLASPRSIDGAMRAVGFKMGPFELADLIGNDVNLASTISVWEQTGWDPRYEPTHSQRELVQAGWLGRKTGAGWYDYPDPEPIAPRPDESIALRILAMLVNEAAALVDRGEAAPADVDTAMRLGTNYPLGPLEWGDEIGASKIVAILDELATAHSTGRYRIADRLRQAATAGGGLVTRDIERDQS